MPPRRPINFIGQCKSALNENYYNLLCCWRGVIARVPFSGLARECVLSKVTGPFIFKSPPTPRSLRLVHSAGYLSVFYLVIHDHLSLQWLIPALAHSIGILDLTQTRQSNGGNCSSVKTTFLAFHCVMVISIRHTLNEKHIVIVSDRAVDDVEQSQWTLLRFFQKLTCRWCPHVCSRNINHNYYHYYYY